MDTEELQRRFREFIKEYKEGIMGWGLIFEKNNPSYFSVSISKKQFKEISEKLPKDFEGITITAQRMISSKFL